ncbi:tetratricopeptide repeat protein [Granulosicoccus sp. 3-233]|uniref:tetratricopeptide repeat protein n=1 Tax=Granulosicoccus sp. 3-233 TaxID=3417969 RepID=UPI003D34E62D
MNSTRVIALIAMCWLGASERALADWQDWWQTPEQQAAEAFEQADHERLLRQAPDAGWAGLGHYQAGDFDAAAQAFAERAEQLQQQGELQAANRALYNQGVSDVRAGRFEEAIEQFDTVLASDPSFADAAHNREIARQLQALQQQQQPQPQSGEDGESGEDQQAGEGDQNQPGGEEQSGDQQQSAGSQSAGEESPEAEQDATSPSDEQSGSESGQSTEENQSSSDAQNLENTPGDTQTEAERQAAAEAAQRALDAEARQAEARQVEDESERSSIGSGQDRDRPLSENEQAAEQLLRRIPDDPAGLLRRRLEQSHRLEYPEARDGREAW